MKKIILFLGLSFCLIAMGTMSSSCSRKTGCPVNENVHVKPNRKGRLPTKGGKSNLFPKNMRRN